MQIHSIPGDVPLALMLWNTAQRLGDVFDAYLARAGLTRYQYFILVTLDRTPQPSQGDLAKSLGVDTATMSHHLSAMEENGFVQRQRDATDNRIQRVTRTTAGSILWRRVSLIVDEYNAAQLDGLTTDELELLDGVLLRIDLNSQRLQG